MILDWLTQDFADLFARDRRARVALWCDAKAEFRNLLPEASEHFSTRDLVLLAFDTSRHQGALWLKWATEAGPGAGRLVVLWLPYAREDLSGSADDGTRLDCLLEYTYAGLTWLIDGKPPTLFGFLKKHGVPLPTRRSDQDPLWRGGPVSPLAKYVRMHLRRDVAFWSSKMLSLAAIEENLIGDPEEHLLRLLADPQDEWEALQQEGIAQEFCSQIQARYAEAGELASDSDAWARAFVTSLVLLEMFAATGERNDFPFATKLPPRLRQPALGELLRHWMRDRDHFETYRRWALDLEQGLDLREWVRTQTGRPQALLSIAKDRWTGFLSGLRELGTHETELRDYLNKQHECVVEEAKGFWARHTQDLPGWSLAGDLLELVEHVGRATESAAGINDAASLVEAYAQDWHRIDLAHWRLLAAARKAEEMELLASIANRFYMQYLDAAGRAFYDAFREGRVWPPHGCRSIAELTPRLYEEPSARRAILVVDALRFDLAAALRDRLGEGVLEAYVANVPSETYVGMTSLLPRPAVGLQIDDGRPQLYSEAAGGDLCYRLNRWKLLEAVGAASLGKDRTGARSDEIHHLWDMTEPPKSLPRVLVLFERGVDELGHGAGHEVPRHFEELLADLERAIRKLRSWGYPEVHVVTDHGFILLHSSANIQPMHLDKDRFALFGARAGLLKPGEQVATAMVPFPLDPSWSVALPPGLRSFAAPGRFFHGGATLQEVVIPHLRLVSATSRARLRARALVPQVDIVTLSVKVELAPDYQATADLFEEDIRVRVFLGTSDAPRSSEKIIDIGMHRTETIPVTLFLHREPPIPKGTEIPVQVIDCDTGQSYAMGLFVRAARDLG